MNSPFVVEGLTVALQAITGRMIESSRPVFSRIARVYPCETIGQVVVNLWNSPIELLGGFMEATQVRRDSSERNLLAIVLGSVLGKQCDVAIRKLQQLRVARMMRVNGV